MSTLHRTEPAPPVRLLHLGLGNFFRAHQAWYTAQAPDAAAWGYAAFSGRRPDLAERLAAQDGLYTLVTRGPEGDSCDVLTSVSRAHPGSDHAVWLASASQPDVSVVTLTVTEAGYVRGQDGGIDLDNADVRTDVATLRRDFSAPVITTPGKLVAALAARARAGAGPLTVVPCDNLPHNGEVAARVVLELAEEVDPAVASGIRAATSFVTTMVDRITPAATPADVAAVESLTGAVDRAPVVTEPYSEWVLCGRFAAGRPAWQDAGATFTDDIEPFEQRKLWLLNGAHSLLAYAGSVAGYASVADAMTDERLVAWLEDWWAVASRHVPLPAADVDAYRRALVARFANPRMRHLLAQIAADGSQKLPVRILPVLRAERAADRLPEGAVRVLAAWLCHLRGLGAPVHDPRADALLVAASGPLDAAAPRVLGALDPSLADDDVVVKLVAAQAQEIESRAERSQP